MEVFYTAKELKNNPKLQGKAEFIEIAYQVLRKDGTPTYRFGYVKSYKDLLQLDKSHLYEVVTDDKPLKIFFDVDFDKGEPKYIVDTGIQFIIDEIENVYEHEEGKKPRVIVLESHRPGKWSYHIILPDIGYTMDYVRNFFTIVKSRTAEIYQYAMDQSVYSSRRNFRILGSSKITSKTSILVKSTTLGCQDYDDVETFIQNTENLECVKHKIKEIEQLTGKTIKATALNQTKTQQKNDEMMGVRKCVALSKVLESYPEFTIRSTGKLCVLNRVMSSMCEFCERQHDTDNTHFIYKTKDKTYYMMCRKYNDEHKDKRRKNLNTGEIFDGIETNMYDMLELAYKSSKK